MSNAGFGIAEIARNYYAAGVKTFLVFLITALPLAAAFSPDTPIEELKLKDGSVLHHVVIMSFSPAVVMAKWTEGRGTIRFDQMPDDLQAKLAPWRPAERPPPAPLPVTRDIEIPADIRQHVNAIFNRIPKLDSTKLDTVKEKMGPARVLRGQCFVTTKGGQNYKLGGVTVEIFSKAAFDAYQAEITHRNASRQQVLSEENKSASEGRDYSMSSALIGMLLSDHYAQWSALPTPAYSVETDADGNFSLTHRIAGDYVVFARATRDVVENTEYYVWRVNSSDIADPERFFLTNANMD